MLVLGYEIASHLPPRGDSVVISKVSNIIWDKDAFAAMVDQDQTHLEGASSSGSILFAQQSSILR